MHSCRVWLARELIRVWCWSGWRYVGLRLWFALHRFMLSCVFICAFGFVCMSPFFYVSLSSSSQWCTSGCVVECRVCHRKANLSPGYFTPRSTQPSIPPGSVNEYQLHLGRQRQVWLIPIADERVGVQVRLWNPLRTRAIPERFCGGDSLWRGAISSVCTLPYLTYLPYSFWR